MVNIQHYLISGRFIATMGHFIALLILFSTINNNINVSLSDNYSSTERSTAVNTSWVRYITKYLYLGMCSIERLLFCHY
jgi:hypothetical protein